VVRDDDLRDGGEYTISYSPVAGCPNGAPVANAGADQTVDVGAAVQLDAAASSDPDGQPLTYQWTFIALPAGSGAVIANPATIDPTFIADKTGLYDVQLVVSDGRSERAATVRITTCSDAPAGLISWWRGDLDANDNNRRHHATLEGATTFGQGLRKTAFVFDGIDARVRINGGESLSANSSGFAVSFWTYFDPSQLSGNEQSFGMRGLIGQYDQSTPDLGSWFFTLHDGLLSFSLFDIGNSASVDASTLTNRFVHVAGVFDGTEIRLFVDGQLKALAVNAMPVLQIADPVMIGLI